MSLEEFTQDDGDKVFINPMAVVSVEEHKGKTRVHLATGKTHTVIEAIADVIAVLES